jgi:hypothetical protein
MWCPQVCSIHSSTLLNEDIGTTFYYRARWITLMACADVLNSYSLWHFRLLFGSIYSRTAHWGLNTEFILGHTEKERLKALIGYNDWCNGLFERWSIINDRTGAE